MQLHNESSGWDLPQTQDGGRRFGSTEHALTSSFGFRFGLHTDELFEEYVELRDRIYRADLGFPAPADGFDEISRMLFVSDRCGKLVGGARLVPRTSKGLPLEDNGFALADYLSTEFIEANVFAEVSRIAVEPPLRSPHLMVNVFKHLSDEAALLGASCVLTIAPRRLALMTKHFSYLIGSTCMIRRNVILGPKSAYHHLGEMCMCVITPPRS